MSHLRKLYLKSLRDLVALRLRAVVLVLIAAAGLGIPAGGYLAERSLRTTRDTFAAAHDLADLTVGIVPGTADELPSLGDIPGIAATARRYLTGSYVTRADGANVGALLVYLDGPSEPAVNRLELYAGRGLDLADPTGVVVDRNFALTHGVRIGDALTMESLAAPRVLHVVGIGVSPEFMIATANPNLLIPAKGSLAVLFVPATLLSDELGYSLYNSIAIRYQPGADEPGTEQAVLDRLRSLGLTRVATRAQDFSYRFLEEELKGFAIFMPAVTAILGLVIVLVTALLLGRLIQTQHAELGALFAFGYRPREVVGALLLLPAVLGVCAVPPGLALALVVRNLFTDAYAAAVGMPPPVHVFALGPLLVAGTIIAMTLVLATLRPVLRIARLEPHSAIRGTVRDGFTTRTLIAGSAMHGLSVRYAIRDLMRRPRLTLATVAAIALAAGGAVGFRSILSATDAWVAQLARRDCWDAAVDFRVPLDAEETARVVATPGVQTAEPYLRGFAQVETRTGRTDYVVMGLPAPLTLRRFDLVAGHMFSRPDAAEAIVNRGYGAAKDWQLGDRLTLLGPTHSTAVQIVGFTSEASIGEINVPLRLAQAILDKPGRASGLLVTSAQPLPQLRRALFRTGNVAQVSGLTEVLRGFTDYVAAGRELARLGCLIQLAIATLVLFAALHLNLLEHQSEYGTLAALGHGSGTMARVALIEVAGLTALGLLASVPIGGGFAIFLDHAMTVAWFDVPLTMHPTDIAWVAAYAIGLLPLAAIPGLYALQTTDLPTLLRAKGFG